MRRVYNAKTGQKKRSRRDGSRGIALILTLLLLTVMVAMTLAMVIAVCSDTLITRYYKNFRSSFYAADSGVNIARQYMLSQIVAAIPSTFSSTAQPLATTTASTVAAAVVSQYGNPTSINAGQAAASWPGQFNVVGTPTLTLANCQVSNTGTAQNAGPYNCTSNIPTCTGTCTGFGLVYSYTYAYSLSTVGQALANEQQNVQDSGTLIVNIHAGTAGAMKTSFAAWGTFIDSYPECSSPFAPGTLTGPFFTNGAWTFESGTYTFTGTVGSVSSTFGYDFSNGCVSETPVSPNGYETSRSGGTINPTFQAGFTLGANAIPLPTNDYSQKEAAVDGLGNQWTSSTTTAQMDALMNADLKTVTGAAYPVGGTTTAGVYLPYTNTVSGTCTKAPCITGGGIYVENSASSVKLTASNPTTGTYAGDSQQVFTITQGSTTTTVTVDLTANVTIVQQGTGTPLTINGVPENYSGSTTSPATMLYVDGTIGNSNNTGLSGPGQGVAAIQNGAAVTVTAAGNIDITGDLLYKEEPVTTTQNQIAGTPADTLIPANNYGQVLGLFTATGDIAEYNQQSNGNLEIDASLAMISSGGSGGWVNDGNAINTVTVVGGRVASQAKACNCNTRNMYFDQRFSQGGFAPPWFPSTTVTPSATDAATTVTTSVQRTQWLDLY